MNIEKLIESVRLCGSTPKVDQCKQWAYWSGGDMSKCIPRMTTEAATALSTISLWCFGRKSLQAKDLVECLNTKKKNTTCTVTFICAIFSVQCQQWVDKGLLESELCDYLSMQ